MVAKKRKAKKPSKRKSRPTRRKTRPTKRKSLKKNPKRNSSKRKSSKSKRKAKKSSKPKRKAKKSIGKKSVKRKVQVPPPFYTRDVPYPHDDPYTRDVPDESSESDSHNSGNESDSGNFSDSSNSNYVPPEPENTEDMIAQNLLRSRGIQNKSDFRKWLIKNHPDKNINNPSFDLNDVQSIIAAASTVGYAN